MNQPTNEMTLYWQVPHGPPPRRPGAHHCRRSPEVCRECPRLHLSLPLQPRDPAHHRVSQGPAIFSLASLGFELKFCDTFEQSQILSYFATIILLHTDRPSIMRRGKRLFKCLNMFLKIYEIEFKNSNFRSVSTCLRKYVQSCYIASGFLQSNFHSDAIFRYIYIYYIRYKYIYSIKRNHAIYFRNPTIQPNQPPYPVISL